jgi:hypothetical protein
MIQANWFTLKTPFHAHDRRLAAISTKDDPLEMMDCDPDI